MRAARLVLARATQIVFRNGLHSWNLRSGAHVSFGCGRGHTGSGLTAPVSGPASGQLSTSFPA